MKSVTCAIAVLLILIGCQRGYLDSDKDSGFSDTDFEALLNRVADGWNRNDAAFAAAAFSPDAVYVEPPDKQRYNGREALFEFFGGATGRNETMQMSWHHTSFNEQTGIGAGEFTFAWPAGQVHGMVSIQVVDGLIHRWREYYYESELDWQSFSESSRFIDTGTP